MAVFNFYVIFLLKMLFVFYMKLLSVNCSAASFLFLLCITSYSCNIFYYRLQNACKSCIVNNFCEIIFVCSWDGMISEIAIKLVRMQQQACN